MTRHIPTKQLRLVAVLTATTALVLSATLAVSYARPFGSAGYGGYGASSVDSGR